MQNKRIELIPLIATLAFLGIISMTTLAQVSDVSDDYWSIVVPSASAINVNLGQVLVNDARDSVVTGYLTNTGPVAIRIDSIFFTGTDAGLFSLVSGIPPFEIDQGDTKSVEFRFAPTSVGIKNATINVHTQIDTLTQSIQGEGVLPRIEVAADLIDFGEVIVNDTKDSMNVAVLRNTGSTTLVISGIKQLGPDEVQFSMISSDAGFSLSPGDTKRMDLRFAPTTPGRTSGRLGFYYDGPGSPAIVNLFGDGKGVQGIAELAIDTIRANAGDLVEVPIYLKSQENLVLTGATGFYAELRFNSSLLAPFGTTPIGTVTDGERRIILEDLPLQADAQGALAKLQFIATLGTAEGTPLHLENAFAMDGTVDVTQVPGYFLLSDVCHEGGARLFFESGQAALAQNRPNPFNSSTLIEYQVIENGPTRLYVTDMLGRTVAVLVDNIATAGHYSIVFDASTLSSGTYIYVLQTPTERYFKLMEVAK